MAWRDYLSVVREHCPLDDLLNQQENGDNRNQDQRDMQQWPHVAICPIQDGKLCNSDSNHED